MQTSDGITDVGGWKQGQEYSAGGYWQDTQLLHIFCYLHEKPKISQFISLMWVALAE